MAKSGAKVERARPVTLAAVARDLGLSKVAVSKALRGHIDIGAATRARVAARAQEMGYQPNAMALSFRTQKTRLIGIVVPTFMDSFFAQVLEGIGNSLGQREYQPIVIVTGEQEDREVRQIEALMAKQVEGFIVISCQRSDARGIFHRLREREIPFVLAGRRIDGASASFVGVDNFEIGKAVTLHLISQGRKRIAHLRGPDNMTSVLRRHGFEAALKQSGLKLRPGYVIGGLDLEEVAGPAVEALLKKKPRPDAIFCYNDSAAIAALRVILAAGLRVPRDIAIAGAGNIRNSDLLSVPLTTVDQSPREMGERAAELLISQLESVKKTVNREIILPIQLLARASSQGANSNDRTT